ncbi:hypothetical protein FXN63_26280 [Pigmentiphaga aceris]|uniref:Uncharacterized protein n=1 Tax=Pigmentiphaga aceris TaxID=1940612 RepID=A0A5C0B3Z4_9BURK|nr:hypothetical protein [Pigmentiphaga aceris]QEI08965.1 hypothetical protein FXN63_26280 [Pigmentiphaga aceris]
MAKDIVGMEFDWFAVDKDGNVALFATAGAGPVPEQVFASLAQHDELAEHIPVAGWGSSQVWNSFAQAGLFAYDWRDAIKAYVRVAEPTQQLGSSLAERLRASSLPRLAVSFPLEHEVRLPVEPIA